MALTDEQERELRESYKRDRMRLMAERAKQHRRIAQLEAALMPFAEAAKYVHELQPHEDLIMLPRGDGSLWCITVQALRDARQAQMIPEGED